MGNYFLKKQLTKQMKFVIAALLGLVSS